MGTTKIEWADKVWNVTSGCTPISAGCANCFAARMAKRLAGRFGYPADDPFRVTLHPNRLDEPLRWRKPSRVFVVSMGDLFHEDVPDQYIDDVFSIMAWADRHEFMVLTKRPERMREWVTEWANHRELGPRATYGTWPLSNVALGVTVENQEMADQRIPILLDTPAAKRFVSIEPALSEVDLTPWLFDGCNKDGPAGYGPREYPTGALDLCILGGETGPGARPMHPDWARKCRDDCEAAGVPFMFKHWGEWLPAGQTGNGYGPMPNVPVHDFGDALTARFGRKAAGRLLDGREHNGEVSDG